MVKKLKFGYGPILKQFHKKMILKSNANAKINAHFPASPHLDHPDEHLRALPEDLLEGLHREADHDGVGQGAAAHSLVARVGAPCFG